jgi:hypothetical protein
MPDTDTSSPPEAANPGTPTRRRRLDLVLGVVLGLVLGLGVVSAFVFLGSEGAIDAPRITGVDTGKPGSAGEGSAPPAATDGRQAQP